ncbi:MAG: hypothetical protein OHK0011_26390 [Turneriella sp.]
MLQTSRRKFHVTLLLALGLGVCQKPPEFVLAGYFFVGAADEAAAQRENPVLVKATTEVIQAVMTEDREKLLSFVHPKEGAIIDAKAFVSYAQVRSALYDSSAVLSRVLWDDEYWKETAPADNVRSYRSIFARAGEIKLGLFWYSATECEVRIDFRGRPSMGIMGNLIFRKRGDSWYLMNFF